MITVQKVVSSLVAFLLLLMFATLVAAGKPDKSGGGGKPTEEKEDPVEVVYVDAGVEMMIDGYMNEWAGFGCNLFPQY
jgi:hypothetical protein